MDFSYITGLMDNNENLIFHGDNVTILNNLKSFLAGSVDCIYIDPPYNSGEKYTYYADALNHDSWLSYMKSVLILLKDLLKPSGSLWISIDDREFCYLKILCDEIFGRKSFVDTVIWQKKKTRENRKIFSNNHEYILVYAIDTLKFKKKRNLIQPNSSYFSRYSNPDKDPRGPWQSVSANVPDGHASVSQYYRIKSPSGKVYYPPKGRCWAYSESRMKKEIEDNNIWFGVDGSKVPRIKKFLKNNKSGLVPETLWVGDKYGSYASAKSHLNRLDIYDDKLFDTPKPEQLIKNIIEISTKKDDLVLDAFLGSGTTAAVCHKMCRKYIGIEKNHKSVSYISKRLDAVINGELGGISKDICWTGGGKYFLIS